MKNLKSLIFGLAALCLAFGLVFSVSAFTTGTKKSSTLTYRYNGNDEGGLHTAGNWSDVSNQEEPEGCEPGEEIPCFVQFDSSEYANIQIFIDENPTLGDMIDSERIQTYKDEVVEP